MKSTPSDPLRHYLTQRPKIDASPHPTNYIVLGTACVNERDLVGLHGLLPQVRNKAAGIADSARLRRRIELLATFFEESPVSSDDSAVRESAFVLYYFLKGYDLIPDVLPEIGLLDDALLVETVCRRNQLALRSHWVARRRTWPEDV